MDRRREAIRADRQAGLRPAIVVGNAGTVKTGAIDPLHELADVCAGEGLWLHADGAYGAMASISPKLRPLFAGLERADSVAADPHKWLYVPYEAGAALVREAAERVGFPLLLKAVAGGGGGGIRLVTGLPAFAGELEAARREARNAFGDDRVMLERYLQRPRHVEFQVLADTHGTVLHLFERECSVQRRHQPVVEESHSPAVDVELRARMPDAADPQASAMGYAGAGNIAYLRRQLRDGADPSWRPFYERCRELLPSLPATLDEALARVHVRPGDAGDLPVGVHHLQLVPPSSERHSRPFWVSLPCQGTPSPTSIKAYTRLELAFDIARSTLPQGFLGRPLPCTDFQVAPPSVER